MTTRELADQIWPGVHWPLNRGPGWRYGTSADVLGAVIEVISGKKLSEFMQDELFAPSGNEATLHSGCLQEKQSLAWQRLMRQSRAEGWKQKHAALYR